MAADKKVPQLLNVPFRQPWSGGPVMSITMKWFPLAIALSLGTTAAVAEEAWQQQEQAREQQAQQDLASVSRS